MELFFQNIYRVFVFIASNNRGIRFYYSVGYIDAFAEDGICLACSDLIGAEVAHTESQIFFFIFHRGHPRLRDQSFPLSGQRLKILIRQKIFYNMLNLFAMLFFLAARTSRGIFLVFIKRRKVIECRANSLF